MKKAKLTFLCSLCLALILTLSACAINSSETEPTKTNIPTEPSQQEQVTQPEQNTTGEFETSPTESYAPVGSNSTLSITFIDVGQGDAALVSCDGEHMLIDGGDKDSSSVMYTFLKDRGIDTLKVLIATHRDADHVGGLAGALNYAKAETAYCSTTEHTSKAFQSMVKYLEAGGTTLEVPSVGTRFHIGSAEITILGPVKEYDDPNNNSIVLRIDFGNTSFLFTGDMELQGETDLLDAGTNVKADVLKVGHHGSSTSTGYRLLREAAPKYAVISCGKGNAYGHPHEETLSKLRDAEVIVYRTDLQGDITCHSDGTTITWETGRATYGEDVDPAAGEAPKQSIDSSEDQYIGNVKSYVFHTQACTSLPAEANRTFFESVDDAVRAGFRPCKNCLSSLDIQ